MTGGPFLEIVGSVIVGRFCSILFPKTCVCFFNEAMLFGTEASNGVCFEFNELGIHIFADGVLKMQGICSFLCDECDLLIVLFLTAEIW